MIKHNETRDFRQLLSVYFNPCDFVNRATCKEENEIAHFLHVAATKLQAATWFEINFNKQFKS